MKYYIMSFISPLLVCMSLFSACEGTWIMYDTSQKDHLYMENLPSPPLVSFALVSDEELVHDVKVKMMGMPSEQDRSFTVEYLEPTVNAIQSGTDVAEVFKAKAGTDFEAPSFILPAGAVETTLSFKLKRTADIKDKYASVRFRIVEDESFVPMTQDSTDLDAIVSSEYEVLFNDGEPVCPSWWSAGAGYEGWHMLIGKFYVAKYRKFLELFHAMEASNAAIYEQMVEKYGYNLDNADVELAFFQKYDPAVWATYVLIPMYNYFKELYENDPDHPDADIDTFADKGTAGTYWKDPVGQLK